MYENSSCERIDYLFSYNIFGKFNFEWNWRVFNLIKYFCMKVKKVMFVRKS